MRNKENHICLPDSALAKEIGISENEVTESIERLIKEGLVKRIRCPKCGGPAFIILDEESDKARALIGGLS
jgi:DNA-binding MarR family transcriptional regulator